MDNVNRPAHYTDGKIEVIDFIEDKNLNYHRGNAVKYISRAGKKDPAKEIEDLRKASWYINREIDRLMASDNPITPDTEDKPVSRGVWRMKRGKIGSAMGECAQEATLVCTRGVEVYDVMI